MNAAGTAVRRTHYLAAAIQVLLNEASLQSRGFGKGQPEKWQFM